MNRKLICLGVVFFATSVSLAQIAANGRPANPAATAKPVSTTTPLRPAQGRTILAAGTTQKSTWQKKNLNISLHKQFMNFKLEAKLLGKIEIDDTMDNQFGFGAGLNNYSVGSAGVAGKLYYTKYNQQSEAHMLDVNVGYGMNQNIFPQAGLNMHRFAAGDAESLGAGVGYQLGIHFRSSSKFGGDLLFRTIKNSGTINSVSVDTEGSGLEFGASYFF